MKKISIIMPVYNGSAYIENTLKTVFAQKSVGYELIIVNDGSTDNTVRLLKENINQNYLPENKLILIDKEKAGVSVARNTGLLRASGEYVVFFDSDDLMLPEYLSKMYQKAEMTNSEIVMCGHDKVNDKRKCVGKYKKSYFDGVLNGEDALLLLFRGLIMPWTGSVLYKRSFLMNKNIRYRSGCTNGEDGEFIWKAFFLAKKVACVKESLVWYMQRRGSAVRSVKLNRFHEVGALLRLRKYFKINKAPIEILEKMDDCFIPEAYVRVLALLTVAGYPSSEINRLLKNKKIKEKIQMYKPYSLKSIFKKIIYEYCPKMYFLYLKIKQHYFLGVISE